MKHAYLFSCHDSRSSEQSSNSRASRVGRANLPPEYELVQLIEDIGKKHSTWNPSVPACEWKGVKCEGSCITKIDWIGQSLFGSIRWPWLPQSLQIFLVSTNQLTGTVELDALPSGILHFNVMDNAFSGKLELQHLPQTVKRLNFSYNQFEGEVDLQSAKKTVRMFRFFFLLYRAID